MVCVDDDDCIANTIFNDASGTCTDGICICDEGFDGIDSWEDFETCHIRQSARTGFRSFLLAAGAFYVLGKQEQSCWKSMKKRKRKVSSQKGDEFEYKHNGNDSSAALTLKSGMDSDEEDIAVEGEGNRNKEFRKRQTHVLKGALRSQRQPLTSKQVKGVLAAKKRNSANLRLTIFTINLTVTNLSLMFYIQDTPQTREGGNPGIVITFILACGFLFSALFALTDIYYTLIPNLRLYGKLMDATSVFVTYPKMPHYIVDFYVGLTAVSFLTFGAIFPAAFPGQRRLWDTLLLLSFAFIGISNAIFTYFILRFAMKAFSLFAANVNESKITYLEQLQELDEAVRTRTDVKAPVSLFDVAEGEDPTEAKKKNLDLKIKELQQKLAEVKFFPRIACFVIFVLLGMLLPGCLFIIVITFNDTLRANMFITFGIVEIFTVVSITFMAAQIILYIHLGIVNPDDEEEGNGSISVKSEAILDENE